MQKIIFVISILFGLSLTTNAQIEKNYSFYNLQQSIVNPAAAGYYDQIYGATIFNTQLVGFEGAPISGLLDFGLPIRSANLTIGGQVGYEDIGAFKRTDIGVQIAYRIQVGINKFLSFGVTPFVQFGQTDFSKLKTVDDGDVKVGENRFSTVNPNLRIGTFYFAKNFYTGLSVHNVFSQNIRQGDSNLELNINDIHFYYNVGYSWEFSQLWAFQPSLMIRIQGHAPLQMDVNAQFLYNEALGFGVSYRSLSTIAAQINYTHNNMISFGYAFNYGFNYESRATNFTGHELFLGFVLPYTDEFRGIQNRTRMPRF